MKLSIILPIYNVEAYLEECVNSILMQSYRDYEIILVNDGSTDGSPKLCDDLAAKHDCIKVVHKKNGGSSDARNFGTAEATGEYVVYIDSDDFITSPDFYQRLQRSQRVEQILYSTNLLNIFTNPREWILAGIRMHQQYAKRVMLVRFANWLKPMHFMEWLGLRLLKEVS